jgi:protein SCO1/2
MNTALKLALRFLILSSIGFMLGGVLAFFETHHYPGVARVVAAVEPAAGQAMAGVSVGGPFTLVDHTGKKVTEKSWPGKYKLVFFGFTHCPDTCPATLQKMSAIMDHTDPKGEKIAPLFITVDPERDTSQALAAYVKNFSPFITGLTGTPSQIKAVEQSYKVYAAKSPKQSNEEYAEYMEDHSAYIYLMSPDDKLLETFAFDDPAEGMVAKIKQSVK